jgi:HlyD family secretion protein
MSTGEQQRWSAGMPLVLGFISLVVLVGGFGYWAVTANISGAVIAGGRIRVEQNRQIVQHPDGGVIETVEVREGDSVAAGDILVRLDSRRILSELVVIEAQLFELLARQGRLEAERDDAQQVVFDPTLVEAARESVDAAALIQGQQNLFEARLESQAQERAQLLKRRNQIMEQINGMNAQQASLETQLELIVGELETQQSLLDRGLAQASRVLSLRREEARMLGVAGELTAQKAGARGRITEIGIEILKLGTARREEAITVLRDLQFGKLEVEEKYHRLKERLARLDIRAPVAGIVYDLQFFARRSVIRAAEPILYLVPQDRPLVIVVRVNPVDIDQIFVGQEVALRFSALDSRTTPELRGRVEQLSADAFVDERTRRTYFNALITMLPGEAGKLPAGTKLVPGMPVDAFIRTRDRTPLAYLIRPLADYFARAFRGT